MRSPAFLLLIRLIRALIYVRSGLLEDSSVLSRVASFAGDAAFQKFFLDTHLRSVCHYIVIPDQVASTIEPAWRRFLDAESESPLAHLYQIMSNPIGAMATGPEMTVYERLVEIAGTCTDVIECKWCIAAFFRVAPLFLAYNDDFDVSQHLARLLAAFSNPVLRKSQLLTFLRLRNLQHKFLHNKQADAIREYENEFLKRHDLLSHPQRLGLQLEYASCIYMACQFCPIEDIEKLEIANAIRRDGHPRSTQLLDNEAISGKVKLTQPKSKNQSLRGYLFRWLSNYTRELFLQHAMDVIEQNHLRALEFSVMQRVYDNRELFNAPVLTSLNRCLAFELPSAYYASSTGVFRLLSPESFSVKKQILAKALDADEYYLLRNAPHIAGTLYEWFYYHREDESDVRRFAARFADHLRVGNEASPPRFFWIYIAGIRYPESESEKAFVSELGDCLRKGAWTADPVLRKPNYDGATIPSEALDIIRRHEHTSLFARVMAGKMIHGELWNMLGTCVFNTNASPEGEALETAACFYSLALCFARSSRQYDQKYFYNYVRVKALYHLRMETTPKHGFLVFVLDYLEDGRARLFAHKEECLIPLFSVLKARWEDLDLELKTRVKNVFAKISWLSKNDENVRFFINADDSPWRKLVALKSVSNSGDKRWPRFFRHEIGPSLSG